MKYFRQISIGAILAVAGSQNMPAADGIDISHLGTNNTLVRVTDGNSRYVLFPVEESVDDATLNLLLDGKQEKTLRIRLARNRVDYYVPFDISAYKDSKIIFDVVTTQGRASVREASDDACWKNIRLSDTFDTSNTEKYRPAFHHTPLYGWMNDPNGMFYKDGVWHLYYQYNPYGSKWQNMSWGHSTSTDLVNWEHHPVAIEPNSLGQVFSGSCVVDSDNTAGFGKDAVIALYTSAGINQMQSLAYSTDNGETFTIYPGNPIITLESEARDPNMFWNDETKEWNLLLAHALDHEMLIFTSPDLKEWTLQSAFGKGLGAQGGVWECPDMRHLPVEGTDESKWVLICNLNPGGPFGGSAAQYFTGDFDGRKFTADTDSEGNVPTKWMDYGKDHYAHQYRSANTLPRDISLFKGTDGQYYLKTVPSPELLALRDHRTVSAKGKSFGKSPVKFALPEANDGICEINMSLNARKADKVTITLANRQGEKVDMTFDPSASTFSFDRTQSGLTDFSHDFPAVVTAPTLRNSTSQSLRIFVDRSSIEVFDGEGNFVLTNLVFPGSPYTTLSLAADGGKASLNSLEIYTIKTSNK